MITEERIRDALVKFQVREYEVRFTCKGTPNLPEYLGSTLRGALAMAMRRTLCSDFKASCGECTYHEGCAYAQLFEPEIQEQLPHLDGVKDIPRPFVIRPPLSGMTFFPDLTFHIILFGDAWRFLPHLIFALQAMGEEGLGAKRHKFQLKRVTCGDELIFHSESGKLQGMGTQVKSDFLLGSSEGSAKGLTCEFITPLRVKYQSRLGPDLTFEVFLRSLMRRISSLSRLYCDFELDIPYGDMVARSKEIITAWNYLEWKDWKRYSNRQSTKMQMGGMVGNIYYEGNMDIFRPLVNLGRYTHVGKGTIFGLGYYSAWWE